jgi:hypothetical protein
MRHVFIHQLGIMIDEVIHPVALGLHDLFADAPGFRADSLELAFLQPADFLGLLLGDVPGVGEYGSEYAGHFLYFFFGYGFFLSLAIFQLADL